MFKEIYVKNFILIDELHLDFHQGFSVFTGETGAGKSLLIDAISLLCGERANAGYVASGKEYTLVEGVFEAAKGHPIVEICKELDIEIDDEIIITRKITADGKSSVKLNQRSISLSVLKSMMSQMIDIHSQHDTQYLLNSRYHISLLDEYLHEEEVMRECADKFQAYRQLKKEYEECLSGEYNESDLDYLRYQINEIEKAELSQQKVDDYQEELKKMNSYEKLNNHLNRSYELLSGSQKVMESLYEAIHLIEDLNEFEWAAKLSESLNGCYYEIEEAASAITQHLDGLEYDENHVNMINEYLFEYSNLKRKYGNSVEAILQKKEAFEQRVHRIENRHDVLDELSARMDTAFAAYQKAAQKLSSLRKEKAVLLEQEVMRECRDLYLEKIRFEIRFSETEPTVKGTDKVEFYISMNPGAPLKPLANVASGGELSRVMLGLKTVFSDLTDIETLIFDEIDTGVSGKVALAIGKKMAQIAQKHQLFAITHLASVAAAAQYHYVVEKQQQKQLTTTLIKELSYEERIHSLAMIATNSLSESALKAAEELYETAQN